MRNKENIPKYLYLIHIIMAIANFLIIVGACLWLGNFQYSSRPEFQLGAYLILIFSTISFLLGITAITLSIIYKNAKNNNALMGEAKPISMPSWLWLCAWGPWLINIIIFLSQIARLFT